MISLLSQITNFLLGLSQNTRIVFYVESKYWTLSYTQSKNCPFLKENAVESLYFEQSICVNFSLIFKYWDKVLN